MYFQLMMAGYIFIGLWFWIFIKIVETQWLYTIFDRECKSPYTIAKFTGEGSIDFDSYSKAIIELITLYIDINIYFSFSDTKFPPDAVKNLYGYIRPFCENYIDKTVYYYIVTVASCVLVVASLWNMLMILAAILASDEVDDD